MCGCGMRSNSRLLPVFAKENNISDVVLQNIEALAEDEYSEATFCYGRGSVDCFGRKVEMKIEGLSLD